jgi:hypothetical protein
VEIQINIKYTYKVSTWQHDTHESWRQHEWPPFTMTIKEVRWAHRTLVPSYTRKPQWVVRGWPEHYPNVIREVQWGVIQLSDRQSYWVCGASWISYASVNNQSCSPGSDDRFSIDTGGGYHIRRSEYENRLLSTFSSGILYFSLVTPPGLT